jgi:fatty acid desaturase
MDHIDHRQLVAGLSPSRREELLQRSNAKGLAQLTGHLGAIVLLAAAIILRVPYWPVLIVPQGILIAFLFAAVHESVHRTAFRSDVLNRLTANIGGFLNLLPPRWFGYFHFAHHAYTQDRERDPELAMPKPRTLRQYVIYLSGLQEWGSRIRVLLANAAGGRADPFVPDRARDKVVREARIYLVLYAATIALSLLLTSTALLWAWVLPVLAGQPFLRAYLLAEHGLCPYVANVLENTRTTLTSRLVRLLAWNMPYHAEHHAQPSVPFYKLPELHRLARAQLRVTENGYLALHRKYLTAIKPQRAGDAR